VLTGIWRVKKITGLEEAKAAELFFSGNRVTPGSFVGD
jgi:hypothetical protein